MSVKRKRILFFGAGVIGSAYAIKFMEAGIDVVILARSNRFNTLKAKGLQYKKKGEIKTIPVKVIDKLENNDIYDFIFVTVRYDQSEAALTALKENQSENIVTMINNAAGFSSWQAIVGNRLLPAFPGVGGQISEGILSARFPPKILASAMFGEVNGVVTKRIERLAELFEMAKLPYKINEDMRSFLMTHSISDIALLSVLYPDKGIISEKNIKTRKTAHDITHILKAYLQAVQKAGFVIQPSLFKIILKIPDLLLDLFFMLWLRSNMVKEMRLPEYANSASNEVVYLKAKLLGLLNQRGVSV